jgi:hypothetical protein
MPAPAAEFFGVSLIVFGQILSDIPRIPGWLSAPFRLGKARSNEIRPPPTG